MSIETETLAVFDEWYGALRTFTASAGPARGTIAAALVVLERLRDEYNLDLRSHQAPGGMQIRGVSGPAVTAVLAKFNEIRPYLSEGGRTNRGSPSEIEAMLHVLESCDLAACEPSSREKILNTLQGYLVSKIQNWHSRQRLTFTFDVTATSWHAVWEVLREARAAGKEGPVAQYLVGAKLQLRFPDTVVENYSFSTSDIQQGRAGDFVIKDAAFHVTVSPMSGVYEKCLMNLRAGIRPWLLVPQRILVAAQQNAEDVVGFGKVWVQSLESFIGGNVEELSTFGSAEILRQFRMLLECYNKRVDYIESDKSMLIEIPLPLLRDIQLD